MAGSVDQVNVSEYEFSSLLYLNTVRTENFASNDGASANSFEGAWFAFNDEDCDRLVAPRAGRLLAFTSGFENLHQVQPIRNGDRFALSVWFKRLTPEGQENSRTLTRGDTRRGIVSLPLHVGGAYVRYGCSAVAAAVALGVGAAQMLGWWPVGWW